MCEERARERGEWRSGGVPIGSINEDIRSDLAEILSFRRKERIIKKSRKNSNEVMAYDSKRGWGSVSFGVVRVMNL